VHSFRPDSNGDRVEIRGLPLEINIFEGSGWLAGLVIRHPVAAYIANARVTIAVGIVVGAVVGSIIVGVIVGVWVGGVGGGGVAGEDVTGGGCVGGALVEYVGVVAAVHRHWDRYLSINCL
jgi:hypothetical protein